MKFKLFTWFVLLGLLVGACGQVPASGEGESGGGTAVLVIPEEPAGLNRYLADAAIVYQVSDASVIGLTTPNEQGEYTPRLAAELPTVS
ncbi:MAG: hypothetical protein M3Y68_16895, partial [Chloroflexota bacterium]|nr:hypothetical protein [Chloroflexota bacterium]